LAVLLPLFSFFDLLEEMGDVGNGSYTMTKALLFVALHLPGRIHELMPIAAVIGALFALARLAVNSEFNVMRASGLPPWQLLRLMLGLGASLALAILIVGELVTPLAEQTAQQLKLRTTSRVVAQEFKSGLWAKDGRNFVNAREMLPDSTLLKVQIYQFDERFQLKAIQTAQSGVWTGDGHWLLRDVELTRLDETGARIERLPELRWPSSITPELLSVLMVTPERMALHALYSYIEHLKENRQKTTRYEIALWAKLVYPLAAPVMLLLALPFVYLQPRATGVSGRVMIGVLIGLAFYLVNRLAAHLGLLNDWPPSLSAGLPILVFSGLAAASLWLVERR
ncbi:MAG: LPS export ABC transporter permease LptG, partial [Pseudomonadota bacterium]